MGSGTFQKGPLWRHYHHFQIQTTALHPQDLLTLAFLPVLLEKHGKRFPEPANVVIRTSLENAQKMGSLNFGGWKWGSEFYGYNNIGDSRGSKTVWKIKVKMLILQRSSREVRDAEDSRNSGDSREFRLRRSLCERTLL